MKAEATPEATREAWSHELYRAANRRLSEDLGAALWLVRELLQVARGERELSAELEREARRASE